MKTVDSAFVLEALLEAPTSHFTVNDRTAFWTIGSREYICSLSNCAPALRDSNPAFAGITNGGWVTITTDTNEVRFCATDDAGCGGPGVFDIPLPDVGPYPQAALALVGKDTIYVGMTTSPRLVRVRGPKGPAEVVADVPGRSVPVVSTNQRTVFFAVERADGKSDIYAVDVGP